MLFRSPIRYRASRLAYEACIYEKSMKNLPHEGICVRIRRFSHLFWRRSCFQDTAISTLLQRNMSGSVAPKKNKGKEINEFGMRPERDTPEYTKAYKKSSSPKPDPKRKYGTSSQGDKSSRKKSPVSADLITLC